MTPSDPTGSGADADASADAVANLRHRAEDALQRRSSAAPSSAADSTRLLHELQVHQIELELQLEELIERRAEVEASLARYTDLYDFASIAYATLAADSTISQTNLAAAQLLSSPRALLYGKRLLQFVAEPDRIDFSHWLQRVFDSGTPQRCELRLGSPGSAAGTLRTVQVDAARTPDGSLCRATLIDLTERLAADETLRLLEACLAQLNDAVLITEAAPLDAPGPRIVFVNAACERLAGYSRTELIGASPRLLQGPGTDRAELDRIRSALQMGAPVRAELINYRKDGAAYWVEINLAPVFSAAGRVTHFVAIERDITQRKATEHALASANQELARSNAELEQFAYVASHDLIEPLRSVSSSVQLLQKRYQGQLDARADEFIAHAVGGSARMQALIDDLLLLSRVSAAPHVHSVIDSAAALAVACANLAVAIAQSSAQISHDALLRVQADPGQLAQLLQNLIGNALKFCGDRPAVVHVGTRREGANWVFSVADQGIGIEPQYFSRIFELFKRLHTRDEYAGTGIGLAICKKIVERHGGRIWVESQPALRPGTTFCFSLPQVATSTGRGAA